MGLLAAMIVLPILIHLINRLRHKRVNWAAMEFLLASHKKNRNWVWLKQFLLLAARIACLILVLLTIGQVGCNNESIARFLGGQVTHHYIIVDDSLSMNEVTAGKSALDRAVEAVGLIGGRMAGADNQKVTLLRLSQAQHWLQMNQIATDKTEAAVIPADLNALPVDRLIERVILDASNRIQPTLLAGKPGAVIDLVADLVSQREDENAMVYVISDFRESEWGGETGLKASFEKLADQQAAIDLIRCVSEQNKNLSITGLRPAGSVSVAGVPLMMEVDVTNFGSEAVRKTQVKVQSATYPEDAKEGVVAQNLEVKLDELPAILIDEIGSGETISRQFPVLFETPGQHALRASLARDSLAGDDARWIVNRFTPNEKVLLVEQEGSEASRFLSLAMSPGGMTGLQIERASQSKLRDEKPEWLSQFDAVFLLDIDELETSVISRLRKFVEEEGGGLVFFAGPNTNLDSYNSDLFQGGKGLYPIPLERSVAVSERLSGNASDFVPQRHPVFSSVIDIDFSPLDLVQLKRVLQPPPEWSSAKDGTVNVLATVRGDPELPLVVEKKLGRGVVIAVTTTAGPEWNNWMKNPTFPTTLLLIEDYVSRGKGDVAGDLPLGEIQTYRMNVGQVRPEVEWVAPQSLDTGGGFDRSVWTVTGEEEASLNPANFRQVTLGQSLSEIDKPGVYERWLVSNQGDIDLERFVLNVDQSESKVELISRGALAEISPNARIIGVENFTPGANRNRGTSLIRLLMFLLLGLLLLEQYLARAASFHPASRLQQATGHRRSDLYRNRRSPGRVA